MDIEELKQFVKQVGWGFLATTDGRKVGVRPMAGSTALLLHCSPALFCPTSPDYVIIKMSPDNVRVMESADMKYEQVKLK